MFVWVENWVVFTVYGELTERKVARQIGLGKIKPMILGIVT